MLYLQCRVVTGDLSGKVAVWLAVGVAAALLTKGFSLAAYKKQWSGPKPLVWTAPNATRLWSHHSPPSAPSAAANPRGLTRAERPSGPAAADHVGGQHEGRQPGGTAHPPAFLKTFLYDFASRIWGETRYPDNPGAGNLLVVGWFTLLVLGVAGALLARREARSRSVMSLLVLLPLMTVAVVAMGSWATYSVYPNTLHALQGRCVYQMTVALAVVATVGSTWSGRRPPAGLRRQR